MNTPLRSFWSALLFIAVALPVGRTAETKAAEGRFLYVATPGVRDYLEYGGHGVLVSTSITTTASCAGLNRAA